MVVMTAPSPVHIPVLLEETMTSLDVRAGGTYIDCTTGLGGHSSVIAEPHRPGRKTPLPRPGWRSAGVRACEVGAVWETGQLRPRELPRTRRGGEAGGVPGCRWHPHGPRDLLIPDRRGAARVRVRPRRPAGHADGPGVRRHHRRGDRQHLGRNVARRPLLSIGRGTPVSQDRSRDRARTAAATRRGN